MFTIMKIKQISHNYVASSVSRYNSGLKCCSSKIGLYIIGAKIKKVYDEEKETHCLLMVSLIVSNFEWIPQPN